MGPKQTKRSRRTKRIKAWRELHGTMNPRPNTNIARDIEANARPRRNRDNPLREFGTFLFMMAREFAPRVDRWLTMPDGTTRHSGESFDMTARMRIHEAMPGVPQDMLENAFMYVEARIARVIDVSSRARATLAWLGKWARAIAAELERREREGDKAPPKEVMERGAKQWESKVKEAERIKHDHRSDRTSDSWTLHEARSRLGHGIISYPMGSIFYDL